MLNDYFLFLNENIMEGEKYMEKFVKWLVVKYYGEKSL